MVTQREGDEYKLTAPINEFSMLYKGNASLPFPIID